MFWVSGVSANDLQPYSGGHSLHLHLRLHLRLRDGVCACALNIYRAVVPWESRLKCALIGFKGCRTSTL